MIYNIKKYLHFLTCLLFINGFAQNNFEGLGESDFSINHSVSKKYSINGSLRSRYFLFQDANFKYEQRQIDFIHFSTFILNYNNSLSFGLQYRNRDLFSNSSNEFRLTQQYNFNKRTDGIRFGHRLRFEQRIFNTLTVFRPRYRFTVDFPLNGQKLDVGEAYFIGSLEALWSLNKNSKPEFDQRNTAQIGWQLNENLKLQTGLEYRIEAFNIQTEMKLFLLTSAIIKI